MSWDQNSILKYLNEKLFGRETRDIIVGDAYEPTKPTQADKPSPHSMLNESTMTRMAWAAVKEAQSIQGARLSFSKVGNTNSMEPFFDDNCLVLLEETPPGTVFYPGDIVIYKNGDLLIIHSLLERTTWLGEPAWLIGGQNNFLPDGKVPEKNIVKRYVGHLVGKPRREND